MCNLLNRPPKALNSCIRFIGARKKVSAIHYRSLSRGANVTRGLIESAPSPPRRQSIASAFRDWPSRAEGAESATGRPIRSATPTPVSAERSHDAHAHTTPLDEHCYAAFMLRRPTDPTDVSMTIQNLTAVKHSHHKAMALPTDTTTPTNNNNPNKSARISFSVASLLADTRPSKPHDDEDESTIRRSTSPSIQSSEDEYEDSVNQEDSIVDVEDLNDGRLSEDESSSLYRRQRQLMQDRGQSLTGQGPIRPTPFSALAAAAAAYQAGLGAHPGPWVSSPVMGPFGPTGPMFQGPGFPVSHLSSGGCLFYSDSYTKIECRRSFFNALLVSTHYDPLPRFCGLSTT